MKSKVEEAAREQGREAFRLEALATQAGAGTAENADPLPDLAESWGKIMREKLLVPITDQDGNQTAAPRTVILLEDFETFNKPQQLWIKEHLIEGFTADAEARIGGVTITGNTVVGEETLSGRSPSALPAGVHDVEVVTAEGTAVLAAAFTITSGGDTDTGESSKDASCSCSTARPHSALAWLGLLGLLVGRRRR